MKIKILWYVLVVFYVVALSSCSKDYDERLDLICGDLRKALEATSGEITKDSLKEKLEKLKSTYKLTDEEMKQLYECLGI